MEMADSTEIAKSKKQIAKSAFYLRFCESLLQSLCAVLRFLKFTQYPHDPSSAATTAATAGNVSHAGGSAPPPAAADPVISQTSRAIRSGRGSRSSRRVPPTTEESGPWWSNQPRYK